jgi:hypothetical protein
MFIVYMPFFNAVAKEKLFLGRKNIGGASPFYNLQVTTNSFVLYAGGCIILRETGVI